MGYYLMHGGQSVPGMKMFAKSHPIVTSILLTKNSPLLPIFSQKMLELQERGVIKRALNNFKSSGSPSVEQNVLVNLSAGQTALAFVLLATGFLFVILTIGAEILISKQGTK